MTLPGQLGTGLGLLQASASATPRGVLSQDMRSDILGSADRQQSQDVGIGVDLLNWRRVVSRGSCFIPLKNWVDEMPKRLPKPRSIATLSG